MVDSGSQGVPGGGHPPEKCTKKGQKSSNTQREQANGCGTKIKKIAGISSFADAEGELGNRRQSTNKKQRATEAGQKRWALCCCFVIWRYVHMDMIFLNTILRSMIIPALKKTTNLMK